MFDAPPSIPGPPAGNDDGIVSSRKRCIRSSDETITDQFSFEILYRLAEQFSKSRVGLEKITSKRYTVAFDDIVTDAVGPRGSLLFATSDLLAVPALPTSGGRPPFHSLVRFFLLNPNS